MKNISRRKFIETTGITAGALLFSSEIRANLFNKFRKKRPNIVFVLADQWRAQAVGYAGNDDVITPNLDKLYGESISFRYAVSCMPVSTPYRASLMTGQYAQTNGLFLNDLQLNPKANSIGKHYKSAGYNTAYIGKWHLNGNGRSNYIAPENRQGFDYFKALECTHEYNNSWYYDNDDTEKKMWNGYDVFEQTKDACHYIEENKESPFFMILSWGPPHNPYETAPQKYHDMYKDKSIKLRPNVPKRFKNAAEKDLKGYYAHITAMDDCIGELQKTIANNGIEDNTIFIFTSDHGDMLYSQGQMRKQRPYDESILVPFLLKYPDTFGKKGRVADTLLNVVDIMPTLLSMSGLTIPKSVEGKNLYPILKGSKKDDIEGTLIECITPFGGFTRNGGGREYRGVRTKRYTYVKDLNGPWLLFDNVNDPFQMKNLVSDASQKDVLTSLDELLTSLLLKKGDEFLPGDEYIRRWGYAVNKSGNIDYTE
ncbi:MAG: sulfatase [Flavobacteriaceae bacterium]|jgi:arylsulfatase A-like enzyme|nr:sulfatase [Flavobacteriaceae bacterium]